MCEPKQTVREMLESKKPALPKVVFVLGAPGCGKGTQCARLVERYKFIQLSAGDLLRAEMNTPGSRFGNLIASHIREGIIVPVEITCDLINTAMEQGDTYKFLIDGYPRNQANLDGWNREMADKCVILRIIFIDCPEKVCMERCLQRGAGGNGQPEDNLDSLKKRFVTYYHDTMPIIQSYQAKDMVIKVDGTKDPDFVFLDICSQIES